MERDKFLTEAMGECWHVIKDPSIIACSKCDASFIELHSFVMTGRVNDFSTWTGFGKLWEWAQHDSKITREWWFDFLDKEMGTSRYKDHVSERLIHPDRFANAVYEFLKERER